MDIDTDKLDETVLALLWLNLRSSGTAWKTFDWPTMERLHARGFISDPVRKAKSVTLSPEGQAAGERLLHELFSQRTR